MAGERSCYERIAKLNATILSMAEEIQNYKKYVTFRKQ